MTDDRDDHGPAETRYGTTSPPHRGTTSEESSRTIALIPSRRADAIIPAGTQGNGEREGAPASGPPPGDADPTGPTGPGRSPAAAGPGEPSRNGAGAVTSAPGPTVQRTAAAEEPFHAPGLPRRQVGRLAVIGALIVLLGAVVGFGASLLWPTQYAGRASVLYIISQEQPTGFLREDRNLTTQVLLAESNAVLGPVSAQYGLTPAELTQKLTVTVPDGSELLNCEVRDPSPDLAVRLADSMSRQYLQISASSQPSSDQMRYLQGQLTAAQNQMQQLRVDGSAPALAQLPAVADRAGSLGSQLDTLMLAQVAQPQAQIVVPAYPGGAVSPRPGFGAATGAVSGLLVALVTVAILARRWQRRGPES
jgi:hypothetical protein